METKSLEPRVLRAKENTKPRVSFFHTFLAANTLLSTISNILKSSSVKPVIDPISLGIDDRPLEPGRVLRKEKENWKFCELQSLLFLEVLNERSATYPIKVFLSLSSIQSGSESMSIDCELTMKNAGIHDFFSLIRNYKGGKLWL